MSRGGVVDRANAGYDEEAMTDTATPVPESPKRCAKPGYGCPNMKEREGDTSMEYEHYECKVCGATDKLDYEEMR